MNLEEIAVELKSNIEKVSEAFSVPVETELDFIVRGMSWVPTNNIDAAAY
jgi:hypothetical protein